MDVFISTTITIIIRMYLCGTAGRGGIWLVVKTLILTVFNFWMYVIMSD